MIRYRQATRAELDLAIDWAAGEGWNPGLHDGDAFWVADPDGFVCAEEDGQLVATGSTVSADALFGAMSDRIAGSPVALDVPEVNPAAIALAEAHGLTPEFGCARMYLGTAPSVPRSEIYGITSFELG